MRALKSAFINVKKKSTISIVASVAILSAVFILIPSNTAVAQTPNTTTPATTAAVRLNWSTGSTQNNTTNPAVYTVQYESRNCINNVLIGGTLHGAAISGEDAVLGANNQGHTILTTHANLNPSSTDGRGAEDCIYIITVTASMNCSFTVTAGTTAVGAATQASAGNNPTQLTFTLRGKISTDANFFQTKVADLNNAAAGTLQYVHANGTSGDVTISNNAVSMSAQASSCIAPSSVSGITIANAEPLGSSEISLSINPNNRCQPQNSNQLTQNLPAGTPNRLIRVLVDASCTYTMTVQSTTTGATTSFRARCTAVAVLYERNGNALNVSVIRSSDNPTALRINGNQVIRAAAVSGAYIAQVTLMLSGQCPRTRTVKVQYEVTDSTNSTARNTPLNVQITRASTADSSCIAVPNTINLRAATVDRDNIDNSVEVTLTERPVLGRTCAYVFKYPRVSGALSLAAEPGHNFKTGTGTNTRIVRPLTGAITGRTGDPLDGEQTFIVTTFLSNTSVSFVYESRRLPITVRTTFPSDATFTTNDVVTYRIALVGKCARYPEIISNALGAQGVFRQVQVFPGTTLVYDPSLQSLTSSTSQAGPSLIEVTPIVVENGQTFPCEIQVSETGTPSHCTVQGNTGTGGTQKITFAEGLTSFDFRFDHDCSGKTTSTRVPSRGLTG